MDDRPLRLLVDALARESYGGVRYGDPSADIAQLEALLDGDLASKRVFFSSLSRYARPFPLSDDLRERAEALTPRVWEAKISNKGNVEWGLLMHLAFTASPRSLPLFLRAMEFTKPRDQLGAARRGWAVAGIAFITHRRKDAHARKALLSLLDHARPDVVAAVVDAVAALGRSKDERLTQDAVKLLERAAASAGSFEARCLARVALLYDRREFPTEPSDEVYRVSFSFGRASRTIELLAEATLTELCAEVVSSLHWDLDHCWALRLSDRVDHPLLHVCPEGDPWAATDPLSALTLREVGFPVGHEVELLYDFGDKNRFILRVVGREGRNPRAKYPRVAESKGEAT